MKYLNALFTEVIDDPYCADAFVLGYESEGATWTGEITTKEYINLRSSDFDEVEVGFDITTTNTDGSYSNSFNIARLKNYQRGFFGVFPSGSNIFHYHSYPLNSFPCYVVTGNGEDNNLGGYLAEFIGKDPIAITTNIEYIIPSGAFEYNVISLKRLTPTVEHHRIIVLRIAKDAVNEKFFGGDFGRGMPFRVSVAITGTDITPLPSGTIYAYDCVETGSYIDLYFEPAVLTTGTLDLEQGVTTGKIKLKTSDANILIKTNRDGGGTGFFAITGWGVALKGITGFDDNPNGAFEIKEFLGEIDGWYDKIEVAHTTGVGVYTGGGTLRVDTQSYSTPYIAGQLAYIKDALETQRGEPVSWWEVRFRARITATSSTDGYSAFGKINPRQAISYKGYVLPDPFFNLGEVGAITIRKLSRNIYRVTVTGVLNATIYDLYRDDTLHGDIVGAQQAETQSATLLILPTFPSVNKNVYKYKAYLGDRSKSTEFSGTGRIKNYKYKGQLIKNSR